MGHSSPQNICEEYSTGNEDSHKLVRESMAAAKLKTMVNVQHRGQKVQLGNTNVNELDSYCKPVEAEVNWVSCQISTAQECRVVPCVSNRIPEI